VPWPLELISCRLTESLLQLLRDECEILVKFEGEGVGGLKEGAMLGKICFGLG